MNIVWPWLKQFAQLLSEQSHLKFFAVDRICAIKMWRFVCIQCSLQWFLISSDRTVYVAERGIIKVSYFRSCGCAIFSIELLLASLINWMHNKSPAGDLSTIAIALNLAQLGALPLSIHACNCILAGSILYICIGKTVSWSTFLLGQRRTHHRRLIVSS